MEMVNPFSSKYKDTLNIDVANIPKELLDESVSWFKKLATGEAREIPEDKEVLYYYIFSIALSKRPFEARVFRKKLLRTIRKRMNWVNEKEYDFIRELFDFKQIELEPYIEYQKALVKKQSPTQETEVGSIEIRDLLKLQFFQNKDPNMGILIYGIPWWTIGVNRYVERYITNGTVILTKNEFLDTYTDILAVRMENHNKKINEMLKETKLKFPEYILEQTKELFGSSTITEISTSTNLEQDLYPPCIRYVMGGVPTGERNFGITMLLTSFLSYARIYPTTKIFDRESKIEMNDKQVEILQREVLPIIFQAAENCDPPYEEKRNIVYHMGFGMNYELDLSNFNESKWYLPSSCEKIRSSSGTICNPDKFCLAKWYMLKEKKEIEDPKTIGERMLQSLNRTKTKEALEKEFGDKKEVEYQLKAFIRSGRVIEKGISSPFIYYLVKKRMKEKE